jgi:hypothetical protein
MRGAVRTRFDAKGPIGRCVPGRGWWHGRAAKPKRDPSLHRPTRSQEANAEEKASACSAQDDGAAKASACVAQEANAEEKASACVAQDDGLAWWLRRTRWLGGSEGHEVRVALRGE